MRNTVLSVVAAGMVTLGACVSAGQPVALNERVFAADSMQSLGAGCYLYVLGGSAGAGSTGRAASGTVQLRTRLDEDVVVVSVLDGDRTVVEKRYGESFFKAGAVDEFTAAPTSGTGGFFLRYWGTYDPNGGADCAPLADDGPR